MALLALAAVEGLISRQIASKQKHKCCDGEEQSMFGNKDGLESGTRIRIGRPSMNVWSAWRALGASYIRRIASSAPDDSKAVQLKAP